MGLPSSIIGECSKYFNTSFVNDASNLFQSSKTSISFIKGSPENYYIISGIVRDDQSYEAKLVFKKRFIDSPEGPISSHCNCSFWSKDNHCAHVACLFIIFNFQYYLKEQHLISQSSEYDTPLPNVSGIGVTPDEYGTIIRGPDKLQGAVPSATYSSLQYILHNHKIVTFPIPKPLKGKLLVDIISEEQLHHMQNQGFDIPPEFLSRELPSIRYKFITSDGEIISKISLFENLYLFRWDTGVVFHLPRKLKDLVQKLKINLFDSSIDLLIQEIVSSEIEKLCEISIDNVSFLKLKQITPKLRIALSPSQKKNQVDFALTFFDDEDNIVKPPKFLSAFVFKEGLLSSFRKKEDAYYFLKKLVDYFESENSNYKQTLVGCNEKARWIRLITHIKESSNTYVYGAHSKFLYSFENKFLIQLFITLFKSFNELFFRYSRFSSDSREITYTIFSGTMFQGLSKFYQTMQAFDVSVYYESNKVNFWKSSIKFERSFSATKWFDLELFIPNEDLQIIKNIDLENGLTLTSKGLVLLQNDQKDIIKLMKKYIDHETKDHSISEQFVDGNSGPINKFVIPFNRARIFELIEMKKLGIEGILTDEERSLCDRLMTLKELPQYPIPENLIDVLRPYQKTGHNWLSFLYENGLGACLADDMGLGKTLQTISFIQSIHDKVKHVLIACPVSLIINWEKEISKFSNMETYIYHGGSRNFPENVKLILTSFGVLKKECDTTFKDRHFDVFVLDEVQHLKNIRSLGAISARKIQANFRICLTGTPVENDLSEFYNILDLSVPGIWGNLQLLRRESISNSRQFAKKTSKPFILRRTKAQVLKELPPKIENTVLLNFSDEEKKFYDSSLVRIKYRIESLGLKSKYGEILRSLLILRQQCLWKESDSSSSEENIYSNIKIKQNKNISSIISTKIAFLMETLEQIIEEGHQVIVFSQFTTYLNIIQSILIKNSYIFARIDGTQTIKKRNDQVELFQNNKVPIFLISLKAGGVGLNLTAASYVFIMDPWWNPAVENQATDRAHRIGQKKTLNVYRPIIKGSIEEKVLELQESKKELFHDLLSDEDPSYFSGKLTMDDFKYLLS